MTRKQINKAIAHFNLEVAGKAGDGCYYFIDTQTGQAVSGTEPVWIGSMRHLNKLQWIGEAEIAAKARDEISRLDALECPAVVILRPSIY